MSEGLWTAYPKEGSERSDYAMLTIQTILLTSSLLLVLGMVGALACLTLVTRRESATAQTLPAPPGSAQ